MNILTNGADPIDPALNDGSADTGDIMKRLMLGGVMLVATLAGPAMAADMPVKAVYKAPPLEPAFCARRSRRASSLTRSDGRVAPAG